MKYKILGAGPAGLACAIKLAQNGYEVDVFEQSSTIGGYTGNNVQVIRNYGSDEGILGRFKKEGLTLSHFNPIEKIIKYSPSYKAEEIYSDEEAIFYTFKRGVERDSLENQLARQARELGVNIKLGQKEKISNAHIVACGSKFDPVGMGFGAVFENHHFSSDTILFFLGSNFAKRGYSYVAPFGKEQLTVAIISFEKAEFGKLESQFNEFVKNDKIVSSLLENANMLNKFAGYGHYNVPKTAVHKHKLFIGGAAGFVEPSRGFGVKYALLSGILAAKSIISKEKYDLLWQKEFKTELESGFYRKVVLDRLRPTDWEQIIKDKRTLIKEYDKTPGKVKDLLLKINGRLVLGSWQNKFEFDKIEEI